MAEEIDPLLVRLQALKCLPMNSTELKKNSWIQFLTLWSELLAFTPKEKPSCYEEFAQSFDTVFKLVNFFSSKRDPLIARQTFLMGIEQINRAHIRDYLQLSKDQENTPENGAYFNHVERLTYIVSQCTLFISFIHVEEQNMIRNHVELLQMFIDRIDRSMPEHSPTMVGKDYSLGTINERLLSILWNMSDRTIVVPILLQRDLAKKLVKWLQQAAILNDNGRRPLISITHNLSRHDDGADELSQHGAIQAIKQYQLM